MSTSGFIIELRPSGLRFEAQPSQTVLAAAREAGLRLPSSCRNGTCRACLAPLLGGQVRYTLDWPGLSADEKAQGLILPCVAVPLADLVLRASPQG